VTVVCCPRRFVTFYISALKILLLTSLLTYLLTYNTFAKVAASHVLRAGLLCADVPLRNYSLTHSLTPWISRCGDYW